MEVKIGLDFDGVILDAWKLKAQVAKELFGVELFPNCFSREQIVGNGFLTAEQYNRIQEVVYYPSSYLLRQEPVFQAMRFLRPLSEDFEVKVITSRTLLGVSMAQRWLKEDEDLYLDFISTGPGKSKREVVSAFDVYMDDDLEKLEECVGCGAKLFLFSQPYNANVTIPEGVYRVVGWEHFYPFAPIR